jgi:CHAT domain-containing protein/tetratricopeptide (TPR) repeat protein
VDAHPELLGDAALRVLDSWAAEARAQGHEPVAEMVTTHHRLLRRAIEIGVGPAFAEIDQTEEPPTPTAEIESSLDAALDELAEADAPGAAAAQLCGRVATMLHERHQATGSTADLEAAIRCAQRGANTTDPDDRTRAALLDLVGTLLTARHQLTGELGDLRAAVQAFRAAAQACRPPSLLRGGALTTLGNALVDLYAVDGQQDTITAAIAAFQEAAELPDPGRADPAGLWANLAHALGRRHAASNDPADLNVMIDALERAAALAEAGTPRWHDLHNNLAVALCDRYENGGRLADLDHAIATFDRSLRRMTAQHPDRGIQLAGRGNAWRRYHQHDHAATSIGRAIEDYRDATVLATDLRTATGHRTSLANALMDRFHLLGASADVDEAIAEYRAVRDLTGPRAEERPGLLTSLANALHERWNLTDAADDADAALEAQQEAVALTSPGSPDRAGHLSSLGNRHLDRFTARGNEADIDAAVTAHADAVTATPAGDTGLLAEHLGNQASGLRTRYQHLGDPADLDQAEAAARAVVSTVSDTDDSLPGHLLNWAITLQFRYRRRTDFADLDAATAALRRAERTPQGRWTATVRHTLATVLRIRYGLTRDPDDLDKAIRIHERALESAGDRHEHNRNRTGLANALHQRFDRTGDIADLQRAVDLHTEALTCTGEGSPDRPGLTGNLGGALIQLAEHTNDPPMLQQAVTLCRAAVDAIPADSPDRPGMLCNLAVALSRTGDETAAAHLFRMACTAAAVVDPRTVLVAASGWAGWATTRGNWAEAAEAYRIGLDGLHGLVGSQTARQDKESWLRAIRQISTGLARSDIATGDLPGAVLALDRGRALLLAEDLAERNRRPASPTAPQSPGFAAVAQAAASCPLVYLAADDDGGMALIVRSTNVEHVRLDGLRLDELRERTAHYLAPGITPRREGIRDLGTPDRSLDLDAITAWLWPTVVQPILKALGADTEIVIVAGGFLGILPLHAAWTSDPTTPTGRRYALDHLTISYAPNAGALNAARERAARLPPPRTLLSVIDPTQDLPGATAETAGFAQALPALVRTSLRGTEATRQAFEQQAVAADVLHIACHGEANLLEPMDSALVLAEGQHFTVRNLMAQTLSARLAVLSACETQSPGVVLPDEVLALPTALLQTGAVGVIASQWKVPDWPTAMLVTEFARLWAGGTLSPATALRQAQRWLRDTTNQQKLDHYAAEGLAPALAAAFRRSLRGGPDHHSHADPRHWAAFTYVGT